MPPVASRDPRPIDAIEILLSLEHPRPAASEDLDVKEFDKSSTTVTVELAQRKDESVVIETF
jgi:hypothetical protein